MKSPILVYENICKSFREREVLYLPTIPYLDFGGCDSELAGNKYSPTTFSVPRSQAHTLVSYLDTCREQREESLVCSLSLFYFFSLAIILLFIFNFAHRHG